MTRLLTFAALLFSLATAVGASDYTNPIVVPEAWPNYGVGDPFVLRYNGVYYLYCSTRDHRVGIRVWTSPDLVTWSAAGLCTDDPVTTGAYAPEVTYWNGWFWLSTSPAGNGHFLFRARSPLGPFERFTGNQGLSIDGTWFRDEDGRLYFYHASPRGILGHEVAADGTMGPETLLEGTWMGHWTEGPEMIRHGGRYYLFLTGNHVLSDGYRENYAVSDTGPLGPFVQPDDNPLALSTDPRFRGLGHGSPVLGPDLVSWWLVYHNLVGPAPDGPPVREMNLDRLRFTGEGLRLLGPSRTPRPAPESARTGPLEPAGADLDLGPSSVPRDFTAEATILAMPDGGGLVYAAKSAAEARRITFDRARGVVRLEGRRGTELAALASTPLFSGFDFTVPHTLRLEARGDRVTLWVDGWKAWSAADPDRGEGRLGFRRGGQGFRLGWWGWTPGTEDDAAARAVLPVAGRLGPDRAFTLRVDAPGRFAFTALVTGAPPLGTELLLDGHPLVLDPTPSGSRPGTELTTADLGTAVLPAGDHRLEVRVPAPPGLEWRGLEIAPTADPDDPGPGVRNRGLVSWIGPDAGRNSRMAVTVERRAGPDLFGLLLRTSRYSRYPDQVADGYFGYKVALSGGRLSVTRVQYERRVELGSVPFVVEPGKKVRLEAQFLAGQLSVGPPGGPPWLSVTDPRPLPPGTDGWYQSSARVQFSDPEWKGLP